MLPGLENDHVPQDQLKDRRHEKERDREHEEQRSEPELPKPGPRTAFLAGFGWICGFCV
jgi:hypothetical protein